MLSLITWERGRPARMLLLMVVAELPRGFAGSHYVGSNRNGQAEGEPGRRCRSIQVEEMPEAVPGIVRASRPHAVPYHLGARASRPHAVAYGGR